MRLSFEYGPDVLCEHIAISAQSGRLVVTGDPPTKSEHSRGSATVSAVVVIPGIGPKRVTSPEAIEAYPETAPGDRVSLMFPIDIS
jgi:hypothetical protein